MRDATKVRLFPRQREVLEGLLRGLGEKEVALELGISPHTVHTYVTGIYRHFEVDSRSALLSLWIQRPQFAPPRVDEATLLMEEAMVGC
jgi:DNA-binding NarL/FixJ family response regulator